MRRAVKGKLILESRLCDLCKAEEPILRALEAKGFADRDRFAVRLALEEALANAIKHGNCCDPGKCVTVQFHVGPRTVRITIEDEGGGFNPRRVPDPTCDENLEKPCGRGVMLMRVYMNEVKYNAAGNKVTLVKRRSTRNRRKGQETK